ncbi:MAG: gephyrin-like molybdotransferase Glp [Sphingomonadales bacterium]
MIPVEQALERILASFTPLPAETVALSASVGRGLAEDVVARRSQPPSAVSAMDGYAVRASDISQTPVTLTCVGEAPAGGAFEGVVAPGQAVRIFTGGPVPAGSDAVVMQEDVDAGDFPAIVIREPATQGKFIRPAGLDFTEGTVGVKAGRKLAPSDIGLAAAMNVPWVQVRRKPRVALLANGDELVRPGEPIEPNQIVSSNSLALAALVKEAGGEPIDLGISADNELSLKALARGAAGADMLVTMGGASVGDHDLIRSVLGPEGLEVDFWRIAMRPGKPLIFGRFGATPMIGVPGNPVSALVCALVFMVPAIQKMLGHDTGQRAYGAALLGRDLRENDRRQDYMRAKLALDDAGNLVATPFDVQDSSVLSGLSQADCLVVRPPFAPAAEAGSPVSILPLKLPWLPL